MSTVRTKRTPVTTSWSIREKPIKFITLLSAFYDNTVDEYILTDWTNAIYVNDATGYPVDDGTVWTKRIPI